MPPSNDTMPETNAGPPAWAMEVSEVVTPVVGMLFTNEEQRRVNVRLNASLISIAAQVERFKKEADNG